MKLFPFQVDAVATRNPPVRLQMTALIGPLPNFWHIADLADATVLNDWVEWDQRLSWAAVTLWTRAPFSIHLANVFSEAGVGLPNFAAPIVWFVRNLYDAILLLKLFHTDWYPGTGFLPMGLVEPCELLELELHELPEFEPQRPVLFIAIYALRLF